MLAEITSQLPLLVAQASAAEGQRDEGAHSAAGGCLPSTVPAGDSGAQLTNSIEQEVPDERQTKDRERCDSQRPCGLVSRILGKIGNLPLHGR